MHCFSMQFMGKYIFLLSGAYLIPVSHRILFRYCFSRNIQIHLQLSIYATSHFATLKQARYASLHAEM